jgi:methylenetetrahydrofolate dehydrogenase (NADP+)/methenyltetrahydrofolate cyclohydrolase
MISTKLIDGKAIAATLLAELRNEVAELHSRHGIIPCLAVILVGDDPASMIYVRNKVLRAEETGIKSIQIRLPGSVSESDLLASVDRLNKDALVHGILVQFPMPEHIQSATIISAIDPLKDVDGFHVINAGRLATGLSGLLPCTARACILLLKQALGDLDGLRALVVGRSNIVGRPVAQLLIDENCTVNVAHSRTRDLASECRRADIIVAAVGRPRLIRGSWIQPGATVIDVGINRVESAEPGTRLVGDVAFDEATGIARYITPVPGGVGPMTIACLLHNTLEAARDQSRRSNRPSAG